MEKFVPWRILCYNIKVDKNKNTLKIPVKIDKYFYIYKTVKKL